MDNPSDLLRRYYSNPADAVALDRASGGQMDTQDVIGAIPRPAPSAGLLEALRDRAMRGDPAASGLVAQHDQAKASAPWFSSEGLAAAKPNALGSALSNVPSELMFLSNFLGPGPKRMTAYHGSPRDNIKEFVTPAFFAADEGVARQYRKEGGGGDNLNGLGGQSAPEGWYRAHSALDESGGDRAAAIRYLQQELAKPPSPDQYAKRTLVDRLLMREPQLSPQGKQLQERTTEFNQKGLDYLQSDQPLGKIYEVSLPEPTRNYSAEKWDQDAAIKHATENGHKVATWGGRAADGGEIMVLDPTVIEILRKYGLAGSLGAGTLANALMPDNNSQ